MIPAYAWADVLPDTPDETVLGTKVGRAVDPNSAVFVAVGKSIDSLTSEQQAAFINATTGTEGFESYAYFRGTMYTPTSTVGPVSATYYSTLTGTEYAMACAAARSDIVNYLKMGQGGSEGSNGPVVDGDYTVFTIPAYYFETSSTDYFRYDGNFYTFTTNSMYNYSLAPSTCELRILNSVLPETYTSIALSFNSGTYNISITTNPLNDVQVTTANNEVVKYLTVAGTYPYYTGTVSITGIDDKVNAVCTGLRSVNWSISESQAANRFFIGPGYIYLQGGTNGGGGGDGGGDEPVTPPVEQPTNPTGPTITGPTINVNTGGNNSSTTTADLTPILEMLRIINDNVIVINDNLTSFSDWFGDAWGDYVDWLQLWFERFGLSLDNIYSQQELVGNNIVDELREIEDVLWNIFYKPDPEFPTSTPYDDTQLQGILNGMWADNNGYLNAIQNLLMQISGQIDGLDDVYTPQVGTGKTTQEQLAEDVARLKRKFPFSIPWDLYALLQFLQAPPSAPTFTFTLPYMGTLQCDLSVFDDVAAVCRWVSLLWFVAGLLACTNKLLNLMNVFERND